MVGHSPWSAPPVPVAGQTFYFAPPAGSPGGHSPLSPISPSCIPPPLSAPPSSLSHNPGTLHHLDTLTIPSWPRNMVRGPAAEFFEAVPQQQRLLCRVACTCPNCASGANSRPPTRTALLGRKNTSVTTPTVRRCTARPPTSRHTSVGTQRNGRSSVWSAASGSRAATTSTSMSRLTRSCGRRPAVAVGARRASRTTNQSLLPRMRTPPVQSFSKVKISSTVSSNYHLISNSQAPISYGIQLPSPHPVNNYVAILCV